MLLITGLVQGEPLSRNTGAAMTVFGAFMLTMGIRGQRRGAGPG
jgi:hypothetical protein